MRLSENLAKRISVLYDTYDAEVAYAKSLEMINVEFNFIMSETVKQLMLEARQSMRTTLHDIEKSYTNRGEPT